MTDSHHKFETLGITETTANWMMRECVGMIDVIHDALKAADTPLTEKQLWNLVARLFSPLWAEKDAALRQSELARNIEYQPDHRPLGAIGSALDSDRTNEVEERHISALAEFTVVDEMLRGNKHLQELLQTLSRHQAMIAESLGISRVTIAADKILDSAFNKAAPKHEKTSIATVLRGAFTGLTKRLV